MQHTILGMLEEKRKEAEMKAFGLLSLFASNRRSREMDYLNESVSLYDVERRQREIAQGKFRNR